MDIEYFREYCLNKKGVSESFPFDEETLVFKVMGKIFAICPLEHGDRANLKCEPEYALKLRDRHPEEIFPGYHMNKKHWNTVMLNGMLPHNKVVELIDHSYDLIVAKLKKSDQEALANM